VLASAAHVQVADRLWLAAVEGGARARGMPGGGLAPGRSADFVVLGQADALAGLTAPQALASLVFAHQGRDPIAEVWVAGQRRIEGGRHALEDSAGERFVAARSQLLREV
jgi:formimidoylglutamate deiminase